MQREDFVFQVLLQLVKHHGGVDKALGRDLTDIVIKANRAWHQVRQDSQRQSAGED